MFKFKESFKTFSALSVLAMSIGAYGDDTEVFYSVNVSKPNLLFVLDNSGSMNGNLPGGNQSKLSVLQQSVQQVLNDAPDNVNIGLMRFGPGMNGAEWNTANEGNRTHGISGVAFPLTDINEKARDVIPTTNDVYGLGVFPGQDEQVRSYAANVVNNWTASGGTPLVGALYEAALYYRGEQMRYGYDSPNGATGVGAHPTSYNGGIINNDITNNTRNYTQAPTYKTPIKSSCQANYIVLMSDGQPTYYYNGGANTQGANWSESRGPFAQIMQGNGGFSNLAAAVPNCFDSPNTFTSGKCGPELTHYLATNDNLPSASSTFPEGQDGNQIIETFTIGFGTGAGTNTEGYLKSLATYDDENPSTNDDGYFLANNPQQLADAFRAILQEVAEPKGTLASPGYSVNVKSGLEHEKDIYIPVFDRKNSSRWSGNLKKFKIVDEGGRRKIKGSNGANAVDELGGFTSQALDYWSTSPASDPDGREVSKGGLANLIHPNGRKVYSDLSASGNLYAPSNHVDDSNMANINTATLGLASSATLTYREEIVNFMRGWKDGISGGEPRYHMGDMLHSEPLVITYNKGSASGAGKQQYIFAGTNEGYLHAFDVETGEEKFAFIPSELLASIAEHQFLNTGTQEDHKYGVDGTLTYWFKGGDDGSVDSGDQIILYFGLRRGGTSYYALDVTNINQPKLLWKKSAADYSSMGQSWSAPYLAKVGIGDNGDGKEVVIISGGYDPDDDRNIPGTLEVDNATSNVTADVGNDILILDAKTGDKIWSLNSAQRGLITNSIPGGVRILDTNYNQLIDRMYFADTGGNVWRLDISEKIGSAVGGASKLIKLADLGGTRKFYNEPDVSLMKLRGKSVFTISIGSGYRAHPLDKTINDKFFMLIDEAPFGEIDTTSSTPFVPISLGSLATINISDAGVSQGGSIKNPNKRGWKVNLPKQGEKVLATAVTFDGVVTFTTLVPEALTEGVGIDQCAAPATQGRFYAINILTGGAGLDLDLSGSNSNNPRDPSHITDSDIFVTVAKGEIPGKPQTIFNPLDVVGGECTHPVDIRIGKKLSQATGYDACRLESVYWSDPSSGNQ